MARFLALCLILLAVALPALASEQYANGFTTPGGFTFLNGLWWKGDQPYSRAWVQPSGYYQHGQFYQPAGYYQYSYAPVAPVQVLPQPPQQPQAPPPVMPSPADPNWRAKLLDIKQQQVEQAAYLEAVKALGLAGPGYGAAPSYGVPSGPAANLQLSSAGVSANTVYGYGGLSLNSIAGFYGDLNLAQLYQQANRLAENAQRLSGQATQEFGQLVGAEGANRARVAEHLAKAEVLKAMYPPSAHSETRTLQFQQMPPADAGSAPPLAQAEAPPFRAAWASHAQQACARCHGGGKAEGGFQIEAYPKMSGQEKAAVLARLTTADAKRRMPRDGPPVTAEQLKLWQSN